MRKSLVALVCVFTVSSVLPATTPPAYAESGLFDIIFGKKKRSKRQRQRELERLRAQQPAPKIKGPTFYTYKPDALKSFDLSELAVIEEPVEEVTEVPDSEAITVETVDATGQPDVDAVEVASVDPVVSEGESSEPRVADDVSDVSRTEDTVMAAAVTEESADAKAFREARGFLDGYKIRALNEVGTAVKDHYKSNPEFVWVTDGAPNERALAARETMAAANEVGLSAADYRVALPRETVVENDTDARQRSLVEFEMNMSSAALNDVLDASRGRIDPNRLSGYHDFERKSVDLSAAMSNLAATSDVSAYLQGSSPSNRQFTVLVDELETLRKADSEDHIEIADGTFLKSGRSSPELKNIVAAVRKRGSDALLVNHGLTFIDYDTNGGDLYTKELVALVKDFQKENGLAADGIVGKMTIAKLTGMSNQSKIDKIVLAMERLRWLPRDLGTRHVFINQPAYRAALVDNDRDEISMRVVVGKRSNQTSFFQDEIETVEYNPYWGVPRSIIVNEMLPKLRQDPSYLDRIGYQLTDRRGRRVSSTNVDWYSVNANTVPVDVRQPPGRKNALGELKILFPNKHAIYMHDTPSKSLFDRDSRAFSHGCVRLHDPRGMAAAVLGKSRDHIAQQIAQGQNLAEEVENKIPVYVAYFTAWPKEDGSVGYYGDMYGRDAHLDKAIKRTSQTRDANG